MRVYLPFCAALLGSLAPAAAQPTPCEVTPPGYYGPCYYGVLPAFFDDFEYTTALSSGPLEEATGDDLFGPNLWYLREGVATTRAWYRYNRGHLPFSGTITRQSGSVLRLELPAGIPAESFQRGVMVKSGVTMREGTYHWRVRFSDLWAGQWVRQAVWTTSPNHYLFERRTPTDTVRYHYWSELDFENENHYQGEWRDGRYRPDFLPRMQVTNHSGHLLSSDGGVRRLDRDGIAAWEEGTGTLVRSGFARGTTDPSAPTLSTWADAWWHLMIVVDGVRRTVTYRMLPETQAPTTVALGERSVTIGPSFYPEDFMSAVLSLHWLHPADTLANSLWMDVDWFYFTPLVDLSDAEVKAQVRHLRQLRHQRVNTTGRPTREDWDRLGPPEATVEGPLSVECNTTGTWNVSVSHSDTRFLSTYRYRIEQADGSVGPWLDVYDRVLTLTPTGDQVGVLIEANFQDVWAPHPVVTSPNGWLNPHPENYVASARFEAGFSCGEH